MARKFQCSACGHDVYVRHLNVGDMAKCRSCGVLVRVPENAVLVEDADVVGLYSGTAESFTDQFVSPSVSTSPPPAVELTEAENETLEKSEKWVKQAWWAGLALGIHALLLSIIGVYVPLASGHGFLTVIDVVFILMLVYLLRKKSRFGAVMLVVFYFFERLIMISEFGGSGVVIASVLMFFFVRGVIGAFRIRKLETKTGVTPAKTSQWIFVPATFISVGVMAVLLVDVLVVIGMVPDTKAVTGDELSSFMFNQLVDYEIVDDDDSIVYFYSDGLLSVLDDGNFFTPKRVVSYVRDDSGIMVTSAAWEDVRYIDVVQKGEGLDNTLIEVGLVDRDYFYLWVSPEMGRDSVFFHKMLMLWDEKTRSPGLHESSL